MEWMKLFIWPQHAVEPQHIEGYYGGRRTVRQYVYLMLFRRQGAHERYGALQPIVELFIGFQRLG
jgi:hypothetical protein